MDHDRWLKAAEGFQDPRCCLPCGPWHRGGLPGVHVDGEARRTAKPTEAALTRMTGVMHVIVTTGSVTADNKEQLDWSSLSVYSN